MATAFRNLAPRIMRDLMAESRFGLSSDDAAAIVGNLAHETLGFTKMQEMAPTVKGSRGGYGWAQWTGPRRVAFEAWCDARGLEHDGYEANYSFLYRELATDHANAVAAVKAAGSLKDKVIAFEKVYEGAGVKSYSSRLKYAREAIAAFSAAPPTVAAESIPAPSVAVPANPASKSWFDRLGIAIGILPKTAAAPIAPVDPAARSTLVTRVQKQLQALGYGEVGLADGLAGPKLRAAIDGFCGEQTPPIKSDGRITDEFLAALPKAKVRAVSVERATATAKDLRAAGNEPARGLYTLGWLGSAIFGAGGIGQLDQTGVLDSLKTTSDSVGSTFATLQSGLTIAVDMIQWCFHHWPLFAIGGGVYILYRVARAIFELIALFRSGVMGRATVRPM